ncbi:cytochrome b5-like [Arachis duranensis]|uniref:Cytochrome b5 heme-binding domain-containing protein n=2 Tax=Arachis TaxID=3817 RepID=A0A445DH01_ARAHY|nr:cytochrome b5-like [Arachis duranensis]XP_025692151.1 cytochrome b5-like [Arachis hypogaea]QHO38476.1 Cytochrome [Arachis hypogaea]RYR62440.1 hypothetical protein Ahy_A04g020029 [Arachis hypogaea]
MSGERKVYTFAEVSQHKTYNDCWLIIDGKVYDVTKFLDDHPGGGDVVVSSTAKDATDDFEDVGHSKNARKMLNDYYIGDIDLSTMKSAGAKSPPSSKHAQPPQSSTRISSSSSNLTAKILQFLIPLIILGLAFGVRFYKKSE